MSKPEDIIDIDFGRANDLGYVQAINRAVADRLYPKRTFASMMLKMYSEIGEVVDNPDDPEELADVLIMVLDRMDIIGANAGSEILKKVNKNVNERSWALNPITGVYKGS